MKCVRPPGLLIISAILGAAAAMAAPRNEYRWEARVVDSGVHDGPADGQPERVFTTIVRAPGATWLRLHFGETQLDSASYITLTSIADNGWQRLDARSLVHWHDSSAFFNGEAIELSLYVASGDRSVSLRVTAISYGVWNDGPPGGDEPEDLCGADNRVASTDPRVGRVAFSCGPMCLSPQCTAWIVSNGAMLTAGHCVDSDPDEADGNCGPLLPDGVVETDFLNGVIEFNVPMSLPNGQPVIAHPNDQYPIDPSSLSGAASFEFEGCGEGLGKDYAVFACLPNSNTGLTPVQAQGDFFRMTRGASLPGATVRVTGYGVDDTPPGSAGGANADNQTQQTAAGPFVEEVTDGLNTWLVYQVDSTGGTSGAPVTRESGGLAIGVHTNSGCVDYNGNFGTSFEHNLLELALQTFPGEYVIYVDSVQISGSPNGTVFEPFTTLAGAVNHASSDILAPIISIVAGSYPAAAGNALLLGEDGKALLLTAPVGSAVIGE